ncbi:hypothetical protein ACEPAI_3104 [Sanghuangporus weigelae]
MQAHDSILQARVRQTRQANRRRRESPFELGDLVYISTKNMNLPKQRARKLIPKFIGPYKITRIAGNDSYEIDLPRELKIRGIHPVFHASLLRIHVPNDDRLFPGRDVSQVTGLDDNTNEWIVESIDAHYGKGPNALFKIVWKAGDHTWLPYEKIKHLEALNTYFEVLGIDSVEKLPMGSEEPDTDDPQITLSTISIVHEAMSEMPHVKSVYQLKDSHKKQTKKLRGTTEAPAMDPTLATLEFFAPQSNFANPPPEKFTEPDAPHASKDWATFDPATSTAYLFAAAELCKVHEFHRYIEMNSIPPGFQMPERYLTVRRLYNQHVVGRRCRI